MKYNDKFGINMKQWCKDHESEVLAALENGTVTDDLVNDYMTKITWLQHERLVHLIVTVMVVVCELFFVALALLHPEFGILPSILVLILAVLLGFYFYHYFILENTVQRWYRLADYLKRFNS